MNNIVAFHFMDKPCFCLIYIDVAADPCYMFLILINKELIDVFGEDITIKTDFEQLLESDGDHDKLIALKQSVFDCARLRPEFTNAKQRLLQYENRKCKV